MNSYEQLAMQNSHLNLPERIHQEQESALVLEAVTVSGFGPPPTKYLKHCAYFNGQELFNPEQVKDLVNYMNSVTTKLTGEPVTIINKNNI